MEWEDKLQAIVDYVENHLQRTEESVDPQEIAEIAGCSFDFFQKVFSYMNGFSFSEYIRSRKMTLAGYELKSTDKKVIDISYQYGYDSPTSFTKAFQQFHGLTPKEARRDQARLQIVPKMQVASRQNYSWKLERRAEFRLIGKSIRISQDDGGPQLKVPEFWDECQKNGVFSRLIGLDGGNPPGLFGLFGYYDETSREMDYSIMVMSDEETPEGFTSITIPSVTWAVFDCRGAVPQAIQNGWQYLREEWLIQYPFRHADCPELEWYSGGNAYAPDYLSQIWIPILEET